MNNIYKIKEEDIKNLFIELHNLTLDFKKVSFNYIPREQNLIADSLVKEALGGN
jgi:ribonuclease HI